MTTVGQLWAEHRAVLPKRLTRLARQLIAHRLGMDEAAVLAFPERAVDDAAAMRLRADLADLAAGRPAAHLFGRAPFLDWEFLCDARALVPRPETEALAEAAIARLRARPPRRALDMCCGGGVLGLSLALAFPAVQVWLADVSAEALALCRDNIRLHRLAARAHVAEGDLWRALDPDARFDFIIANPPYAAAGDPVQASVRRYEPALALDSGDDGMAHAKAIVAALPRRLAPDGLAALELGHRHRHSLEPWLRERLPEDGWRWTRDPFGVTRFLWIDAAAP